MPLTTIQTYAKNLLDQTPMPLGLSPMAAYITPPNPGVAEVPTLYIWDAEGEERRESMPRAKPGAAFLTTGAFKFLEHKLEMYVTMVDYSDDIAVDSNFPACVDAVLAVLRNTLMPVLNLPDPVTGLLSDITAIGERMRWRQGVPRSLNDQRMLWYVCWLQVDVLEKIQA
jgi:hypothetical protein